MLASDKKYFLLQYHWSCLLNQMQLVVQFQTFLGAKRLLQFALIQANSMQPASKDNKTYFSRPQLIKRGRCKFFVDLTLTEYFADAGIVHVRARFQYRSSFFTSPDHEGVHRPFDVLRARSTTSVSSPTSIASCGSSSTSAVAVVVSGRNISSG